jgi:hypothetical protein
VPPGPIFYLSLEKFNKTKPKKQTKKTWMAEKRRGGATLKWKKGANICAFVPVTQALLYQ